MRVEDYQLALQVRCPRCGAGPGQRCVDRAGREWGVHLERLGRVGR